MARSIRQGFTLVEMLVVIAIIGILAGMLLPAVQYAREIARSAACQNNLAQLAKACQDYHSINNRFPGWKDKVGRTPSPRPWTIPLLPYLDQQNLYDTWFTVTAPTQGADQRLPFFVCPSDGSKLGTGGAMSYAANAGRAPTNVSSNAVPEHYAHGVFHNYYDTGTKVSIEAIKDGQQNTMLFTENVAIQTWHPPVEDGNYKGRMEVVWFETKNNSIWTLNEQRATIGFTSSMPPRVESRPSSFHTTSVNMVFCDGHTKSVNEAINYNVYRQIMTSDGAKSDAAAMISTPMASQGTDY